MKTLRATAAVLVLACASCRGMETAQGPGFVLTSPFGREATGTWKTRVERELAATAAFLDVRIPDPPLDVRLDAVELGPETDVMAHFAPSVDGTKGWTIDGHEVHVIVDAAHDGLFSMSTDDVLRHEFVHALLARAGLHAPAWLGEGLAHEVEGAVKTADGLRLHPAPVELVVARAYATTFDVPRVWSWDGSPNTTRDDQSSLRLLSRSFVRFLIERDGDAWRRNVAAWATLRPGEDPSIVQAWRSWLDETEFVARIERGTRDPHPDVRRHAADALPSLAECVQNFRGLVHGLDVEIGPKTDVLAIAFAAGDDPVLADAGGRYLYYFRARDVSESELHRLSDGAAPPWSRLIALAVATRRGGNAEPSEAQALWDALPAEDRRHFTWLRAFLPLTR